KLWRSLNDRFRDVLPQSLCRGRLLWHLGTRSPGVSKRGGQKQGRTKQMTVRDQQVLIEVIVRSEDAVKLAGRPLEVEFVIKVPGSEMVLLAKSSIQAARNLAVVLILIGYFGNTVIRKCGQGNKRQQLEC